MAILNSIKEPRVGVRTFPPSFRRRWGAGYGALWLWLLCLGVAAPDLARAGVVSHEYPLKAVFLLNFAHFTDWPTNALPDSQTPFVIGVLGDDPFGSALDDAVRGENWNGHAMTIQRYRQLEEVGACQILFISNSELRRLPKILAALKGQPVLTVTDENSGADPGASIQFLTENNKIHFRIKLAALKAASLSMSSKLLRVAEIAPESNP